MSTGGSPTPRFLAKSIVLAIHRDQIESFGGIDGVRDEGLLDSALAQPSASFGGTELHASLTEKAAAYLYHLTSNHPFLDGNKRTAFAVMDTFLRLNGLRLLTSDDEAYDLVLAVAARKMSKKEIAAFLERNVRRPT